MNPLLNMQNFPQFSDITAENIEPAVTQALQDNHEKITALLAQKYFSAENFLSPLQQLETRFHKLWSCISHCHSVADNSAYREAYNRCLPKVSQYFTALSHNKKLYTAIKSIKDSEEFSTLSQAQQKAINNSLRDFQLSGVDLDADKKKQFANYQNQLSQLTTQFSQNVLDSTQSWQLHIEDEKQLAGLTAQQLEMLQQAAQSENKKGYLISLNYPSYLAIMQQADNRQIREKVYHAFVTRASGQAPHDVKHDNSTVMLQILKTRKALAELLGFNNFSEYSLATKMADSPDEVLSFLWNLVERSKSLAKKEMQDLRQFAKEEYAIDELQPWDVTYLSEELRKKRYSISQEEIQQYFPLDKVLEGLFTLLQKLYHIHINEIQAPSTWHEDVKFYEVKDEKNSTRGYFYLDLFVRKGKRDGAWMDDCQVRHHDHGKLVLPIAFIVCNFAKATGDKPSLLRHDDVVTLFHEFGHAFHHLLTKIDVADVSGINGVEWDAVELPSQFMENWCWQKDILHSITRHAETGETLPQNLYEKMLKAKNYHSGMQMLRQLEFALFDFILHQQFNDTFTIDDVQKILNDVRDKVSVMPHADYSRFQHSFSHIFAGGYAAGYYSYKWAEVLSADAFAKFEETGLLAGNAGQLFLRNILEKGGSEDMKTLYKNFRGREASIDALLVHSGICT